MILCYVVWLGVGGLGKPCWLLPPPVRVPSQKTELVTERGVLAGAEWEEWGLVGEVSKIRNANERLLFRRIKEGFIMLGIYNKPA